MNNYFEELNNVNVNEKTEKKGKLTYLSWVYAWGELKKRYPDSFYTIYENADGLFYHHDGCTAWVKTGVTVNGIEHIEYLPVMDNRNDSITLEKLKSTDVNKAIQRSLTKAVARHGLGLYVYAGEDLPVEEMAERKKAATEPATPEQLAEINELTEIFANMRGKKASDVSAPLQERIGFKKVSDLTELTANKAIEQLKAWIGVAEAEKVNNDNPEQQNA